MRLLAASCLVGLAQAAVLRVPPEQVPSLVNDGAFDVIVDVRGHDEYAKGHLPGAVRGVSELPRECRTATVKIAVYCWTGWDRSTPAAYYLDSQISEEGATVYDMGGFQYYDNPPVEIGEPSYTQDELVKICTESGKGEASEEAGPTDSEGEGKVDAELLPPLFEGDGESNTVVPDPEPEPSNSLATPKSDKDVPSNFDVDKHEYAIVHRIKAEKAAALAPSFDYVVDARAKEEYDKGHLPGAIFGIESVPSDCKDAYIAVYCWHGWDRSSAAALYLASQGFKHVYDLGGIQYMNVPQGGLSTTETDAKPCPAGGSSANVEAILAAGPIEMPDSIVDGRKGCDGMINSGKRYDTCGVCDGPSKGKECDSSSASDAIRRQREVDAESNGIVITVCVLGAICLSIGVYLIWTNKAARPSNDGDALHSKGLRKTAELGMVQRKEVEGVVIVPVKEPSCGAGSDVSFTRVVISAPSETSMKSTRPQVPPPPPIVEKFYESFQQKQSQTKRSANTLAPFARPPPPPAKK